MVITVRIGETKKVEPKNTGILRVSPPEEVNLEEYAQIDTRFLKFLHKSWVKIASSKKILQVSSGIVAKCQDDSVFLRVPSKKDVFQIKFEEDTLFYIKRDDENYISLVSLKIEQSKAEYLARKEAYLDKKIKEIEILQKTLERKLAKS